MQKVEENEKVNKKEINWKKERKKWTWEKNKKTPRKIEKRNRSQEIPDKR